VALAGSERVCPDAKKQGRIFRLVRASAEGLLSGLQLCADSKPEALAVRIFLLWLPGKGLQGLADKAKK
jgi:hypothetical protein